MISVIYRWRVQKADESKFKAVWAKAPTVIRESTVGARGSVLLHSHEDSAEFLSIARWDTIEDWRAFWNDPARTEMQEMHMFAERLAAESYEEIADHTI